MQQNFTGNKNNNSSENEQNNEIFQKHEKCQKLLQLMQKTNYFFSNYASFCMMYNDNSQFNQNKYYLIDKDWIEKFVNFTNSNELFSEFECPSEIDNSKLIIEDNSALTIENFSQIYLNNKTEINSFCLVVEEVWIQLKEIFGGGPDLEFIFDPQKKKIDNIIYKSIRVDLLFIKNNIKNIEENDKIEDFIRIEHINIDRKLDVINLKKYINNILQKYKNNFFFF